jgi:hypothetical protein
MSKNTTSTNTDLTEQHWAVEYDAEPIRIRDPVAEALAVLEPGEPFVITYSDVVKAAGHSCPTASGAYRIAQLGLGALYSDGLPVRSEVEVLVPESRDDATYGVMGRLISYVTGAAQEDGFSGFGDGYGDRQNLLTFDGFETDSAAPTFRFRRTDTGKIVEVIYHVSDVPDGGPALGNLQGIIDGTASEDDRELFAEAWHGRVRAVLSKDSLFTVTVVDQ